MTLDVKSHNPFHSLTSCTLSTSSFIFYPRLTHLPSSLKTPRYFSLTSFIRTGVYRKHSLTLDSRVSFPTQSTDLNPVVHNSSPSMLWMSRSGLFSLFPLSFGKKEGRRFSVTLWVLRLRLF